MTLDLVIANARLSDRSGAFDVGVADGLIAAIEPTIDATAPREDAGGALAFGGFVESHIHLDKACILDRCAIHEGTLAEAVSMTAEAKAGFTEADVYERAARVVELAATHGTTRMRTFVEVDPRAGQRSFEAVRKVKADYAFAIDIEICAFAQEGLTNEPETAELLDRALGEGADLVGGCPTRIPIRRRILRRSSILPSGTASTSISAPISISTRKVPRCRGSSPRRGRGNMAGGSRSAT
jgi:cytosine deaminase